MRVVIDSNALRTDELRWWLTVSQTHQAIMTDYAWMEIYKGDERTAVLESLKVLRDFPKQVKILKGATSIGTLDSKAPGMANAMIQKGPAAQFEKSVKELPAVEAGHPSALKMLKEHGKAAKDHFKKTHDIRPALEDFLSVSKAVYGSSSVESMRKKQALSGDSTGRFFDAVNQTYYGFIARHPGKPNVMFGQHRCDHFLWRCALASHLFTKRLISQGSNLPKSDGKIANDLSDMMFAVYGTYLNGVLSFDSNLTDMYLELEVVLRRLGARMPAHYMDDPSWTQILGSQTDAPAHNHD